jgi:VanZ family protein
VSFCDGGGNEKIIIGQYKKDLIVKDMTELPEREFGAANVFVSGEEATYVLSAWRQGVALFKNGKILRCFPTPLRNAGFAVNPHLLLLGNSPDGHFAWEGSIKSIRFYVKPLTEKEVSKNTKVGSGRFVDTSTAHGSLMAWYDFTRPSHHRVANLASGSNRWEDFIDPVFFTLVKKNVLSIPDFRTKWTRDYMDIVINFFGFIPFGFVGALLLLLSGWKNAKTLLAVFCAGLGLSLFIELAQVFIPTRNSELSDLILNSLGAIIGASVSLIVKSVVLGDKKFNMPKT